MDKPKLTAQTIKREFGGLPEQYSGQLVDGRFYYIRFKRDVLSLGVGDTPDNAIINVVSDHAYADIEVKPDAGYEDLGLHNIRQLLAHVIVLPEE